MQLGNIGNLANSVLSLVGVRQKTAPQMTREQAMSARPVRNPSLKARENDEGETVVVLPRRKDWVGRLLAWAFFVPESRPIVLDEVGTFVWEHCDGTRTVSDVVGLLAAEYKLSRREVEVSLTDYFKTLGKRGMVGFLVPKEVAEELGETGKELVGLEDVGGTAEELRQAQEREKRREEEA